MPPVGASAVGNMRNVVVLPAPVGIEQAQHFTRPAGKEDIANRLEHPPLSTGIGDVLTALFRYREALLHMADVHHAFCIKRKAPHYF
ncbi:hypothetical protein [Paludibacterium paludis]|uniref:Uncharacterized protein n=1 Tax=Paludibacterium paludis TaxID=1225769 RepID=A0A918P6S4_9NEIS|nr:hypothetical protein [Paludibacterium paludis]GGY27519.1 hypothetical protein GCM10011289_33680 [Paludibacterium paludis]